MSEPDMFEGFSPAMVIAYIHSELGDDALREFLNMLIDPTDQQIIDACTSFLGTVTAHDIKRLREDVPPFADYADELADMGLEHVADIVMEGS
jgi:hypothetical protein